MSKEVLKHSTYLGEVNKARFFVGDISVVTGSGSEPAWAPDELIAEGSEVTIKYVDNQF